MNLDEIKTLISTPDLEIQYIKDAMNGISKVGGSSGLGSLDKHFRFKKGNFNIFLGLDNVGKSLLIIWLQFISAKKHGWKWVLFMAEDKPAKVRRRLIEWYHMKRITEMTKEEVGVAYKWACDHFVIMNNDRSFTCRSLLQIAETLNKTSPINGLFIDPYNGLDEEHSENGHQEQYKIARDMRLFCNKTGISLWISAHAVSEAVRFTYKKHEREVFINTQDFDVTGHPKVPTKGFIEGGSKWANKADDFFVIHRFINHPDLYKFTEFHALKIKDVETGGMTTALDSPVMLRLDTWHTGFVGEDYCSFDLT